MQKLHGFEYYLYDSENSLAGKLTLFHLYVSCILLSLMKDRTQPCWVRGRENGMLWTGHFNRVFSCGGKRPVKVFEV